MTPPAPSATEPRRRWRWAVLAALLVLGSTTGIPAVAGTAAVRTDPRHPSVLAGATALDWCPANAAVCQDSSKIAQLRVGDRVQMECWIDARPQPANRPRWFYVTTGGRAGFVKAEAVSESSQWKSSPPCTTDKGIMASLWTTSLDHWKQRKPTDRDVQVAVTPVERGGAGGPTVGRYRFPEGQDWSGDCIGFVVLAYHSVGVTVPWKNAKQVADFYDARPGRKLRKDVAPPRGALVFWDAVSRRDGINYGHVAMSVGNGMVVGTTGWDGDAAPIDMYPVASRGHYLGWTYG